MTSLAEPAIIDKLRHVRLPAIPQILAGLLEICRQDDVGISEIATLLRQEPALTARILQIAAGPVYRRGAAVLNLEQSLLAIGTNMVKTVLISEAVFQAFDELARGLSIDLKPFWAHSLSAAVYAREAAILTHYPRPEEAYLGGLLHDVGRLALLCAAPADYGTLFSVQDDDVLLKAEQEAVGITHAESGAWVAEQWSVDSFIADSIRYHHESESALATTHPLLRLVALAHQMTGHPRSEGQVIAAARLCGLSVDQVEGLDKRMRAEVAKLARHVGIDLRAAEVPSVSVAAPIANPARAAINAQVHDMALSSELLRCFTGMNSELPASDAVSRAACVLFGFSNAIVLKVDKATRALKAAGDAPPTARLAELAIPIASIGQITEALLKRRVTFTGSGGGTATIVEQQFLRLLGAPVLVTIPIADKDLYYGVLVGGTSETTDSLKYRISLLTLFGEHANRALRESQKSSVADLPNTEVTSDVVQEYRQAARAMAHEVNNPLAIIRNYLTVLDRKIVNKESVATEIRILQEEIDRVSGLVEGFAELRPVQDVGAAIVADALNDVVDLLRDSESIPVAVQVAIVGMDPALRVACDYGTLKQVFLNLIKNAVEAFSGQGTIKITNNGFTSREDRLYVSITVADNGPGIPPQVMTRLFSPVNSTKGDGHKGLGLSIVYDLIRKMNGQIYCHSNIEGTSFQLLLPLSPHTGKARAMVS